MEKSVFEDYLRMIEDKKITVTGVCKELGISRQTWNTWVKRGGPSEKRGRPSKKKASELEPNVDWNEVKAKEAAEQEVWMRNLGKATEIIQEFLNKTFPNLWCNLRFEHVDAAAYWYTFELVNDNRRQTWSVRHEEVC